MSARWVDPAVLIEVAVKCQHACTIVQSSSQLKETDMLIAIEPWENLAIAFLLILL